MEASFTLNNLNEFAVKDIEVTCAMFGNSGTEIGSAKKILYEIVEPKKPKWFREVSMGFVHSEPNRATCKVTACERN